MPNEPKISEREQFIRSGGLLISAEEMILDTARRSALESKLTADQLAYLAEKANGVKVTKIRYRSNGHVVNGYLIEPLNVKEKIPCIIYNRGGFEDFGALNYYALVTKLGQMASWGYVIIASQYSGHSGSEGKDDLGGETLNDVLILRDILKRHPYADASKIGMAGGSRGGMMTYLALAKVKWIKAAAVVAGSADLARNGKMRPEMKEVFRKAFGGSAIEMKKRSAVHWANNFHSKTPLLMMHGTADWRVSPLDSLDLSKKLLEFKKPHRLVLFEGADHILSECAEERDEMQRQWFERYLKKGQSLPNMRPHGN